MRPADDDPVQHAWRAIQSARPLVIVVYELTSERRKQLVEIIKHAADGAARRARTLADALGTPDVLTVLVPRRQDEPRLIAQLEQQRDRLECRTASLIITLFLGAKGSTPLSDHPSLASYVLSSTIFPRALLDVDSATKAFQSKHGLAPADWLNAHPADERVSSAAEASIRRYAEFLNHAATSARP